MIHQFFRAFGKGLAFLALVALSSAAARADDQERMQGTWKATHAQIGSKQATPAQLKKIEVMIEGDKLTLVEPEKKYVVHFTLTSGGKPGVVEFFKTSDKKERIWHGIYEFDGKELKLCWAPAAHDRPTKFGTTKHNDDRYFKFVKK